MIDSFVLATPLLMLPVVAMFAFVGCHLLFGLDRVKPGSPLLTATAGDGRVDLEWRAENSNRFRVMRGTESGVHAVLVEFDSETNSFSDMTVVNDTTYYYVVVNFSGDPSEDAPSNEVAVRPQSTMLTSFITQATPGTTAAATGFFGMAIVVGSNPISVKALGRGVVTGNSMIHVVKIVDAATGMDLPNAAAAVFTSGGVNAEMRYAALPNPVTLIANASYYIVSQETSGGDRFFNHDTSVMASGGVATVRSAVRNNGTGYVEDSAPGLSYALVDFQY